MKIKEHFRGISLILSAALLLAGCGKSADSQAEQGQESAAIAVKAVVPEVGTIAVSNQFVGTVSPQQQVSVIPLVSGEVDQVNFEIGDEVSAGDVLFHIKDDAARLQKESAELTKQSAEIAAKAQLGAGQVMNNISMESNIKSLEYQIEMAKDQYNQAANGVQDAEDAKDKLKNAKNEINASINNLVSSQEEMAAIIEQAKEYINPITFEWETAYDYMAPDQYDWPEKTEAEDVPSAGGNDNSLLQLGNSTLSAETAETKGNAEGKENGETETDAPGGTTGGAVLPEETLNGPEGTSSGTEGTESAAEDGASQEQTKQSAPEDAAGQTAQDSVSAQETESESIPSVQETESESIPSVQATESEQIPPAQEAESVPSTEAAVLESRNTLTGAADNGYVYFSVELILEAEPVYLAEKEAGPWDEFDSQEEAWEAYRKQQKIDDLKKKTEEMGYSAKDIKTGKADADMVKNAAQILVLQNQAAELQSSEATLESSIKSGETARNTTSKTIDFYEENLKDAQTAYGISNGQAYEDTASALATQIQAANVGVKSAEMQLEYYSPTSPISGTVVGKNVELYGLVQPGYAAYVISSQDAMNVTFTVSGQVRENLMPGMKVTLEKNGKTYEGTITEVGEAVEAQTGGLFTVKAVTEAGGEELASGSAVKLTVDTFRSEGAILIPYDALHYESEEAYVYEIKDHKAVKTKVTVGLIDEDTAEITQGLTADSQIVANWSSQLEDGVNVRIIGEVEE